MVGSALSGKLNLNLMMIVSTANKVIKKIVGQLLWPVSSIKIETISEDQVSWLIHIITPMELIHINIVGSMAQSLEFSWSKHLTLFWYQTCFYYRWTINLVQFTVILRMRSNNVFMSTRPLMKIRIHSGRWLALRKYILHFYMMSFLNQLIVLCSCKQYIQWWIICNNYINV